MGRKIIIGNFLGKRKSNSIKMNENKNIPNIKNMHRGILVDTDLLVVLLYSIFFTIVLLYIMIYYYIYYKINI